MTPLAHYRARLERAIQSGNEPAQEVVQALMDKEREMDLEQIERDIPERIWCRDIDETGSMHPCWDTDPGAIEYVPAARIAELEAERDRLRRLVWFAWKEMNAIRAMSGVPLDFHGSKQGIDEGYWSQLVDAMKNELGDDAKPWPYFDARAALAATQEGKE